MRRRGPHYGSMITFHPDGRVTLQRALPGFGVFIHVELEPHEIKQIREMKYEEKD